jgi:hypothetical protein
MLAALALITLVVVSVSLRGTELIGMREGDPA